MLTEANVNAGDNMYQQQCQQSPVDRLRFMLMEMVLTVLYIQSTTVKIHYPLNDGNHHLFTNR